MNSHFQSIEYSLEIARNISPIEKERIAVDAWVGSDAMVQQIEACLAKKVPPEVLADIMSVSNWNDLPVTLKHLFNVSFKRDERSYSSNK